MNIEHLIIEEDNIHTFSDEIHHSLNDGYTITASNSFWDYQRNCIRYYALLVKSSNMDDEIIPLTVPYGRPLPFLNEFD